MYSIMQMEEKRLQKIKKIFPGAPRLLILFFKVLAWYLESWISSLFQENTGTDEKLEKRYA